MDPCSYKSAGGRRMYLYFINLESPIPKVTSFNRPREAVSTQKHVDHARIVMDHIL